MGRSNNLKFIKEVIGSVRKIIALAVTLVFCYLSISGKVTSDEFIPVFSMIIGYYFGKSTALDVPKHKVSTLNLEDEEE
ncbi:hypothetical protein JCM1393_29520 [Clostridium carnis]